MLAVGKRLLKQRSDMSHSEEQALCIVYASFFKQRSDISHAKGKRATHRSLIRDGPLENLLGGGGGAGEVQKKYSGKEKSYEKKFMHAN